MIHTFTKEFAVVECYKCGIVWWHTKRFNQARLDDKGDFYCPNGHSQAYVTSTAEKLRKEIADKDTKIFELRDEIIEKDKALIKCQTPPKKNKKAKKKKSK